MYPHSPCAVPHGTDLRLQPFLEAPSTKAADLELARLMELATPWIVRAVRHRSRHGTDPDLADAASEARAQVIACLQRLRSDGGAPPEKRLPITDFETYVGALARNTWADAMRARDPQRAKLRNRLHYLLERRTTQHGFALWADAEHGQWAGFASWRGQFAAPSSGARHHQLLTNPRAAAADAFGAGGWSMLNLPDLVAGLFSWLGGPLKLADLTDAVLRLQDAPVPLAVLEKENADDEWTAPGPVDPQPSPCDELRWREYLTWLWQQTAALTLVHRRAFLLHSHCLHEMEFAGVISVRKAAAGLELAAEHMAELWTALPLDDLVIGGLLGVGRQQVINWRKAARLRLGREWRQWLNPE